MDLSWYNSLNKPFFNPPSWIFGPVWTILYILIAISGIIIFNKRKKKKIHSAMRFYFGQLILNVIWSPVFFGAHQLFLALIIIIFMWILIYKTIKAFGKIEKNAAYLLYPYLAWVSFAGILNLSVWLLNR